MMLLLNFAKLFPCCIDCILSLYGNVKLINTTSFRCLNFNNLHKNLNTNFFSSSGYICFLMSSLNKNLMNFTYGKFISNKCNLVNSEAIFSQILHSCCWLIIITKQIKDQDSYSFSSKQFRYFIGVLHHFLNFL